MKSTYKIKKSFRVPFMAAVALLSALLMLSLITGPTWETFLVAALFVAGLAVAIESYERDVSFSENSLSIRKYFRTKVFPWEKITHLGVVIIKNKVYFLLTTTRGLHILSNLLQDHPLLIRALADKLGDEKVEPDVKSYLENPIERRSLVVMTWIAVAILVAIIITKLITLLK